MTDSGRPDINEAVQSYLDGGAAPADPAAREEAERTAGLIEGYADSLQAPDASLDIAVMKRIRAQRFVTGRGAGWRLSPLAAAAVALLALATGLFLGRISAPSDGPVADTAAPAAGEILVRFELNAPAASEVTLVGSFNEWGGAEVPLVRVAGSSIWSTVVPLPPGQHEYMFVIDGERWVPDPRAQAQVDDGFGSVNSVVVVGPRGLASS